MSLRFTQTDKWEDNWFMNLSPNEKLLFLFLADNCDIAGFYEINVRVICLKTGLNEEQIKVALEGLRRGYVGAIDNSTWIWLKNFVKHQKNMPLNFAKNPAHKGIARAILSQVPIRFYKHQIDIIPEGAWEGLISPIGKGIGKGNKGGVGENKIPNPGTPIDEITPEQFLAIKEIPAPNRTDEQREILLTLSRTKYFHLC